MAETIDQFGASVVGLARLWRAEIDRRLKPLGMSEARWLALHHLARNGGELSQGNLAERLGVRGPTLVSQLDLLESHGWVKRHSSPTDRRSKVVTLTSAAKPLVDKIEAVITNVRGALFADLEESEVADCLELLEELKGRILSLRAEAENEG